MLKKIFKNIFISLISTAAVLFAFSGFDKAGADTLGDSFNITIEVLNTHATIVTPETGKVCSRTPTITGTTSWPNKEVVIMGTSGSAVIEVARTTSDANGKFQVAISDTTPLDTGANTLTPYSDTIAGDAVTPNVSASPDPSEVPVIDIPEEGAFLKGTKPEIEGRAKPSSTVVLSAKDNEDNLLLTDVATTTSDSSGNFTIESTDYTVELPKGTNYLSVRVDGVTSNIRQVGLVDPYGVVFDSDENVPITGAVVALYYDNDPGTGRSWILAVPGTHIAVTDVNPQTVGADGVYSFMCIDGDYYLNVSAAGYNYPSLKTSFPSGRVIVNGSKGEVFTVSGVVHNIDQPMDTNAQFLKVRKTANKKEVVVGDIVTYTLTVQNDTGNNATGVYLEDKIPAGFKYISGKSLIDGVPVSDPSGTRPITYSIGNLTAGMSKIVKYQLVVGSGVTFGKYDNLAYAKYSSGQVISNTAIATVKVVPDPVFDLAPVIGKVFKDENENGIQDQGEEPMPNVQIATEEGMVITTDKEGKFHVPSITPGRHVFRLDEKTLPEGAYPVTDKAVIVDITSGLMAKVNFGVKFKEGQEEKTPFIISQEKNMAVPRLNAAMFRDELVLKDEFEAIPLEFRIFSNYLLFISKWQLEIIDKDTKAVLRSFEGDFSNINEPIVWDGKDKLGRLMKLKRNYAYILKVKDKYGREDISKPRDIPVREEFEEDKELSESEIAEAKQDWLIKESRANNLDKHTIYILGETIKIQGVSSDIENIQVIKSGKVELDMAVEKLKEISASDLLNLPDTIQQVQQVQSVDIIVPNGEYDIAVNTSGQERVGLTSGLSPGAYGTAQEELDTGQDINRESYVKHVRVGDNYIFLVGMGDAKMGYNFNRGNIEPVAQDEKFKEGFWSEGKVAYYLKGKIKGKYLVTSSFDMSRDQKEIFKSIDKDKYYPVYGDSSSVNYSATDTQGPLYLLVEWDSSSILWGNYNTGFDAELAGFNRSLYGGKVRYESVSATQFGEPKTKLVVFKATAQQKAAHNEFIGTGGSLYYLKNQDLIEGSDKVKMEIRDKITGLVVSTKNMERSVDYNIDYSEGRILFWKPIPQFTQADSITSTYLLDGNPVYLVVDYEYETQDKYYEGTYGVRSQQAVTDYVTIGGTYVKEEQLNRNYELRGTDAKLHLGKDITVTGEYAESESEAISSFVSTDGGLSFSEIANADLDKGKAYGLKTQAYFFNSVGLNAYYKMMERGFSTTGTLSAQGKESMGFGLTWDLTAKTRFGLSHDIQKLVSGGNLQTQLQVGAQETQTTIASVSHEVTDKLNMTGEYRRQQVTEKKAGLESETNQEQDTVALKADYKLNEKVILSLEEQANLSGVSSSQTSVGVAAKLNDKLSVRAKETVGNEGAATSVGVTTIVNDKFEVYGDYGVVDSRTGQSNTASVGTKAKLDEKTEANVAYSVADTAAGADTESVSFGTKRKVSDDLAITTDKSYTKAEDKVTVADGYSVEKNNNGKKLKGSISAQHAESNSEVSDSNIFGLSGDINDRWAGLFSYEKGIVHNYDGTTARRNAGSFGLSYADKDWLKFSGKLDLRFDEGQEDKRQFVWYSVLEGKLNLNTTVFAKANISETVNTTKDTTDARYKELSTGVAYRPVYLDRLNLLGRYTYLEDNSPSSQTGVSDVQKEKSHTLAGETVYDLTDSWQLVEKLAYKIKEEMVTGFDFTRTSAWLAISRVNYKINDNWKIGAEYRKLVQEQAKDSKQGALVEASRKVGDFVEVGVGYNFTDFNDDLTHLNYTSQGPFVRLTGKLFERTPEEIERDRQRRLDKMVKVWARQLINEELSNPESEIKQEIDNYLYLAEDAYKNYRLTEAREIYEKVLVAVNMMMDEVEEYIRRRLELEGRWKEKNSIALMYYKQNRKLDAREIWQEILDQVYDVSPIYVDFEKEEDNES